MSEGAQPNKHRGDVAITLGGQAKVLRPSFEAMVAIEAQCGSILTLAMRAGQRGGQPLDTGEMAVIIAETLKAHGRDEKSTDAGASTDKVRKLIFEAGVHTVVPVVVEVLIAMVRGGQSDTPGNA
ncbi:hypothetical protein GCM10007973_18440 [Polymorphobacter multimanifer]|uniref:Gene transfer agent family protein n=1 Tax=Polymorphobacter multimanifer TaxID=1070431 RepID=A0A841L5Z5_9SPHN|nr:GTA-gp10 family protein [Polymorphobacter multimanifer]MBB6228359.1 hypothetical protein [Polymorphobacter multimanifer]GGI82289.1 hypothetical protein GCM10007973_18440 [Polymorphobacter multimanifer]